MQASDTPILRHPAGVSSQFPFKIVLRSAATLFLIGLLASAKVQGFGLFKSSAATGFSDILGSPNDHWWWDLNTITYAFDPSFDALFPNPRIKDQVRLGFQQWDNANATVNGANYSYNRANGFQAFGDIRSIFVHELGHVLGFHHSDEADAVGRNFRPSGATFVPQADANNEVMRAWINSGDYNHILSHDELEGFQLFVYKGPTPLSVRNLNFVEVAPGASPDILIRTYNPSDPNNWANGGPNGFYRVAADHAQGARATGGTIQFNVAPGNPLGFRTLGINWDYQNVSGQPTRSFRVRTHGTENPVPIFHYDNNDWPQPFLSYATAPVSADSKDDLVHTWSNPTGGDIPASDILHVGLELDVWDWSVVSASTVSPLGTITAAPVTYSHSWNHTIVIGTAAAPALRPDGISRRGQISVLARGFRMGVTDIRTRVSSVAIADVTDMKLGLADLNRTTLARLQEAQRLIVIDGFNAQVFEPDTDFIFVLEGRAEDLPDKVREQGNFLLLNRPDLVDRELFIYTASENEDAGVGTYALIGTPIIGQAVLPALEILKLPEGRFRICWPNPSDGYVLQHSLSLNPAQWASAGGQVEIIEGKRCVTISDPRNIEFFRLRNEAGVSSGVVGYLNLSLPPRYSMIADQFITGANDVATVLPNPPNGTILYKYSDNGFSVNQYFEGWDNPSQTLLPGEGAFIWNPGNEPLSITFCGNVREGEQQTPLPTGFSIVSQLTPQENTTEQLGLPAENGDIIYQWDGTAGYDVNSYFDGWDNGRRIVKPGEAFWFESSAPKQWKQTFYNVD